MRHQLGLAIFNDKNKSTERIRGGHAVQSYSRRTCASRWLVDSRAAAATGNTQPKIISPTVGAVKQFD